MTKALFGKGFGALHFCVLNSKKVAFKKSFVVSTEERVNTHGFVVDNEGLDLSVAQLNCPAFYDHKYGDVPFGHWTNLRKEGGETKADLIIDGKNETEKEMIRKIENGDIKGASIGADPIKWGYKIIDGKAVKCLAKSQLFEISLTPLPSNTASLALKHQGVAVRLSGLAEGIVPNLEPHNPNFNSESNMKTLAIRLGLKQEAQEHEIDAAIVALQKENETNKAFVASVIAKAKEGLTDDQAEIFVTLSKTNPTQAISYAESQKTIAPENVEEAVTLTKDVKVSELLKRKSSEPTEQGKDSFDYLSKHNKVELARIRQEEPEKYAKLTRDYAAGVRFKA